MTSGGRESRGIWKSVYTRSGPIYEYNKYIEQERRIVVFVIESGPGMNNNNNNNNIKTQ